ncbi:MAG: protein kinase [Verrucomicrobia bacterium]|nr:protein kinase [Verrucomicrobiota bacterium]
MSISENHHGYQLTRLYGDFDVDNPNTLSHNKGFLDCEQLTGLRRWVGKRFGNLIKVNNHLVSRPSLEKFLVRNQQVDAITVKGLSREKLEEILNAFVRAKEPQKTTPEIPEEKPVHLPSISQPSQPTQPIENKRESVPETVSEPEPEPITSPTLQPNQPIESKRESVPETVSKPEPEPESISLPETPLPLQPTETPEIQTIEPEIKPAEAETASSKPMVSVHDRQEVIAYLKKNKTLSKEAILSLAKQLGPQVEAQYAEVEKAVNLATFETKEWKPSKILRQALFIEDQIRIENLAKKFVHREIGNAPRSLHIHVNGEQRIIAIIPKEKYAIINAEGTSKKVLSAATLQESQPIVQIAPLKTAKQKTLQDIEKELKIYKELEDIPGILKIISVTVETAAATKKGLPRQSILAERASGGNLQQVIKEGKEVDLDTQIGWAYRLISTFAEIHKRSVIHGDIKGDNILLGDNGPLVSDFGMACTKKGGKGPDNNKIVPHDSYKKDNCYGTVEYSAPELLYHDKGFTNRAEMIDYQKTESFALGTILYAILNKGKDLTWMAPMVEVRDSEDLVWDTEKDRLRKLMAEGMQTCVEKPLTSLPAEGSRTREQHYRYVIYNLLREDPQMRWKMEDAIAYMTNPTIALLHS